VGSLEAHRRRSQNRAGKKRCRGICFIQATSKPPAGNQNQNGGKQKKSYDDIFENRFAGGGRERITHKLTPVVVQEEKSMRGGGYLKHEQRIVFT